MKTVKAFDLVTNDYHTYSVPSKKESLEYSKKTWGHQFDEIEGKEVHGGLPLVWERKDV